MSFTMAVPSTVEAPFHDTIAHGMPARAVPPSPKRSNGAASSASAGSRITPTAPRRLAFITFVKIRPPPPQPSPFVTEAVSCGAAGVAACGSFGFPISSCGCFLAGAYFGTPRTITAILPFRSTPSKSRRERSASSMP
jgi:hypothetical protein